MDQERFAGGEPAALKHVVPDRENGFRDRGGLDHRQARRHRQCVILEGEAVFGVAAADHKRDDLIAKLPAPDPAPDLHDFAGDFQAWNFGGAFGRGIAALALHDVGPVYARGNDFHQDFALARRGYRRARCNQDFRPARLANGYARHRFRQMVFRHEYPLFQIPLEVRAGRITPPAAGVTTGKGDAKNRARLKIHCAGVPPMPAVDDDDRPKKKITHEIGQDLTLLSAAELTERVALLKAEIARLEADMARKAAVKSAADTFFKR